MNISANLPRWAQAPVQQFKAQQEITGTETSQLDQDTFESMTELAAGVVTLTSNDEVEGVDEAMGQPGVVVSNGLTVHYQGDSSDSEGSVEAIVLGQDAGSEIAMYVSSSATGVSALQMAKAGGTIDIQGSAVEQGPQGLAGYVIAGQLTV